MQAIAILLVLGSLVMPGADPVPEQDAVVALRQVTPEDWQLKSVKVGSPLWSDRDYNFTTLSQGLQGGTILVRRVADNRKWLEPEMVTLKADCCIYAIVRWKYLGKAVVDPDVFPLLAAQGWTTCEEKVADRQRGHVSLILRHH